MAAKEREVEEERIRKADYKALKRVTSDYKKEIAAEKLVAAAIAKEETETEWEGKAAGGAAKIEAQNTKKATQTSIKNKRKASQLSPFNNKRNRRSGGVAQGGGPTLAVVAAPRKLNSRGRPIRLPAKYS